MLFYIKHSKLFSVNGRPQNGCPHSSVARVSSPWSKKYSCASRQQKLQSLKWKIGVKVRKKKKRTFTVIILFYL